MHEITQRTISVIGEDNPGSDWQLRPEAHAAALRPEGGALKRILENSVPQTLQDVVIIYAAVTGYQDGELREENYVNKVYPQMIAGKLWSAIQVTTASGVCSVVDLVLSDPAEYQGFVRQEQFSLKDILENRFGRYYAPGGNNTVSAIAIATGQTGHITVAEDSA